MSLPRLIACLVLATIAAACGGGTGGGKPPMVDASGSNQMPGDASAGACSTLAGSWIITGTCGADLCTITQAGCVITQVTCNSGTHSSSGTINGAAFTYTGQTTNGDDATCTGTIAGNTISGTCNVTDVGTCSFSGTK